MAKIYFVFGFIGSGKTTYSTELAKKKRAFRFSVDEWMLPLYGNIECRVLKQKLPLILNQFKQMSAQLLPLNVPVILDFGLWKLAERNEMKSWAEANQYEYEFIYLDREFDLCRQRVLERNQLDQPNTYNIDANKLAFFWSIFEQPKPNEAATYI